MAKNLIFTKQEVKFLKELVKNKIDFILVGLSAATLQGVPVATQDVDLWFKNIEDPKIKKVLKKFGAAYIPPFQLYPPTFAGGGLGLFDIVLTMHGLGPFEEEIKKVQKISLGDFKVPILSLERIIKSKKATGRQKDKITLPVLEDAWLVIKNKSCK